MSFNEDSNIINSKTLFAGVLCDICFEGELEGISRMKGLCYNWDVESGFLEFSTTDIDRVRVVESRSLPNHLIIYIDIGSLTIPIIYIMDICCN